MSKPKTPRLTSEQRTELAACYCMWCGVDPGDEDWGSEMVAAIERICIPDGMPMCEPCAEKAGGQ